MVFFITITNVSKKFISSILINPKLDKYKGENTT
jgi:hypothetical protein